MSATDPGADGWQLGRDSWMFHRWYFCVYDRPTERGHYSFLLRQLRWKRGPEVIVAGVFRLKMPDGSSILVTGKRGASARLHTVLAAPLEDRRSGALAAQPTAEDSQAGT
jgi:hypothetical protein